MQRVAQSALARDVGKCQADGRTGCEIDEKTRAAFIILDADQKPGEILAAAMWPPVPRGLNIWDHSALQLGAGARNASSGFAWRAGDADQVPGSTFKVVTSIAAADRVIAGDGEINKMVLGTVPPNELYRMLGLRPNAKYSEDEPNPRCEISAPRQPDDTDTLPVPLADGKTFRCLHNYHNSAFDSSHRCPGSNRFGLCEALMVSSNLYFAGLELRLDQSKVAAQQPDGRWTDRPGVNANLDLARAMRRLFPTDRYLDLLTGATRQPAGATPAGDDGPVAAPARLLAEPVMIAAARPAKPGDPRQLQVAQAGFGQAIQASPIAMASVFASVATQRIVRPHLLRRSGAAAPRDPEEGTPLFPSGNEGARRQMIGEIRNGLSAVVKNGTARKVFANSNLRDTVFGKSGTATVGSGDNLRFSLWFSGFTEPGRGSRLPRIAFVCMVTNQGGGDEETGAQVCGPMVRKVLEELERKPR
jgi:cell division protein FtsI/penicillin-binding protein 2